MSDRHLKSVPEIGGGVDLAERIEQQKPARLVIIKREVRDGTLVVDKRLGPPPITPDGKQMIWLIPEDALTEIAKDWPVVFPRYEEDEPF